VAVRLDQSADDFEARFTALLSAKRETAEDVETAVRGIIADVRETGDDALLSYTEKFDRLTLVIQDDGQGFDVRQMKGVGLLGIQERVARLGGMTIVHSFPNNLQA